MKRLLFAIICLAFVPNVYAHTSVDGVSLDGVDTEIIAGDYFDLTDSSNYYDIGYSTARAGYLESSPFSRAIFTTTATAITVTTYNNLYSLFPAYSDVGIRVNGADEVALNSTSSGVNTFTEYLDAGTKTVEIVSGAQTSNGTTGPATIYGSWPKSIIFHGDTSVVLAPPTQTKRIVIYGDSISVGDDSVNPSLQGWPLLVRDAYESVSGSIIVEGYGYRSLNDDCTDVSTCNAIAAKIVAMYSGITNKYLYIQLSTNDYGLNKWNAATFGTNYARFLDAINTADNTILIYAQTAIDRGTETANGSGSSLGDYRTEITNACNARSGFCTTVDGTAIFAYPTEYADSIHPSLAGQTTYANYIKTLFSIP